MLHNYLTIAFRNLWRNKVFSAINITGFAISMAVCLLIMEYVKVELKMNRHLANGKNIYRVNYFYYQNKELAAKQSFSFPSLRREMKTAFPEIQQSARIYYGKNGTLKVGPTFFTDHEVITVDTSFLPMFDIQVLQGQKIHPLRDPHTALLTESAAKKYFGNADPIGKTIYIQKSEPFVISGVVADPHPGLNLFTYSIILPYHHLDSGMEWNWYNYPVQTFFQLSKDVNPQTLQARFPEFVAKNKPDNQKNNIEDVFKLQCVEDIHLYNEIENGVFINVFSMALIALLVFCIATINYINLSIAKAGQRSKEVGVRKVMGAATRQLHSQFLLETLLLNAVAIVLAAGIFYISLPYFRQICERNIEPDIYFVIEITLLSVVGTFASGFYTAFIQSSFNPIQALKGHIQVSTNGLGLRKSLLVFQFTASLILIIGALVIYFQVRYMLNKDSGVNTDRVVAIDAPQIEKTDSSYLLHTQRIKYALSQIDGVESGSASSMHPGLQLNSGIHNWIKKQGDPQYDKREYERFWMDYDYLNTYGLRIIAGRNFSAQYKSDEDAMMLNEAAVTYLGFKNTQEAIGKNIVVDFGYEKPYKIIGILKNYHQASLHHPHLPTVYMLCLGKNQQFGNTAPFSVYSVKFKNTAIFGNAVLEVKQAFAKLFPDSDFKYVSVKDVYMQQYKEERRFILLFTIATAFAIFISCVGLFGMASYTIARRTKEIGIRKVLGASIGSVVLLLSKEYIVLITCAVFLACPVMYIIIVKYLQNYAYKMPIDFWLFGIPVATVFCVFILTISVQTIAAALANPVKSLRSE